MICEKCGSTTKNLHFGRYLHMDMQVKWICNKCINENYRTELNVRTAKGYPQFEPGKMKI